MLCSLSLFLVVAGVDTFNGMIQGVWTVLTTAFRVLLTDGALASQFITLCRMRTDHSPFKKLLFAFILSDLLAGLCLYYFGQLGLTFAIIALSVGGALICVGTGLLVDYSVATWFNYIQ